MKKFTPGIVLTAGLLASSLVLRPVLADTAAPAPAKTVADQAVPAKVTSASTSASTADTAKRRVEATKQASSKAKQQANALQTQVRKDARAAVAAVAQAVELLQQGSKDAALEKLATSSGKLDVAIAAYPDLAMLPVASEAEEHVLLTTAAGVKHDLAQVRQLLKSGDIQDARVVLDQLHSDIIVGTLLLPAGSYPAAIKDASALVADDKSDQAVALLTTAMTTLVRDVTVIPVPEFTAEENTLQASLVLKQEKDKAKAKAAALDHLALAADQLEVARLLGYVQKDQPGYQRLADQISELRKQVGADQDSAGLFDKLKAEFKSYFGHRDAAAQADKATAAKATAAKSAK